MKKYREPQALSKVAEFMTIMEQPVLETPVLPTADRMRLRVKLLQEELDELKAAIDEKDLIEVADAFADLQYVLSGAIHEFGLGDKFADLFDEVHRSNMSKICTSDVEAQDTIAEYRTQNIIVYKTPVDNDMFVIKRSNDDKVMKSINYSKADLSGIIYDTVNLRVRDVFKDIDAVSLPAIQYLAENHDPHTYLLISCNRAELLESRKAIVNNDFID